MPVEDLQQFLTRQPKQTTPETIKQNFSNQPPNQSPPTPSSPAPTTPTSPQPNFNLIEQLNNQIKNQKLQESLTRQPRPQTPPKPVAPPATPSAPSPGVVVPGAAAGAGAATAAEGGGALGFLAPVATVVTGALALVLLDPFGNTAEDELLMPKESPKEIQKPEYPFTGGQENGALYRVSVHVSSQYHRGYDYQRTCWGPIGGARLNGTILEINSKGWTNNNLEPKPYQEWERIDQTGDGNGYTITEILRLDGKPDTKNPPPITPPINSAPGRTNSAPPAPPEVGNGGAPPPAPTFTPPTKIIPEPITPKTPQKKDPSAPPPFQQPKTPEIPQPPEIKPKTPETPQQPKPNTGTEPPVTPTPITLTPAVDFSPGETITLYGPSSNPGNIKTTSPFGATATTPASIPSGQTFTPTAPSRAPQPQPTTPETPLTESPPEKSDTEKIKQDLERIINTTGLGLTGLTAIKNQTTPEALKAAAKAGTCDAFAPNGCNADIRDNAKKAADKADDNNKKIEGLRNLYSGFNFALIEQTWQNTLTINSKLGAALPGGIGGFLQTAFKATRLDKILNALTLITSLHNAAMLSRNLASTLGDVTSQALAVIGLKDENDSPLDINAEVGKQVDGLFSTLLGKEAWTGVKTAWNKANTIIATTTQITSTVRSLWDSSREVLEWTAENTGKIGNALKKFRVVGENAYKWMPEQVTHTNAWALKLQRFRDKTDSLDDAASSLSSVLGEVQSIQSEFKELNDQKETFDKNLKDLTPKSREENKPVADTVKAARDASKAPANAADVFRGQGESTNA